MEGANKISLLPNSRLDEAYDELVIATVEHQHGIIARNVELEAVALAAIHRAQSEIARLCEAE